MSVFLENFKLSVGSPFKAPHEEMFIIKAILFGWSIFCCGAAGHQREPWSHARQVGAPGWHRAAGNQR